MAYVFDDHRAIFAGFTLGSSISRLRTTTWNSKLSYDSKLLYTTEGHLGPVDVKLRGLGEVSVGKYTRELPDG